MSAERYPHLTNNLRENLKVLNGGVISFDIDAVTQATCFAVARRASHEFKKEINRADLKTYTEMASIAERHGMCPDDAIEYARRVWNNDDLYLNSPPNAGMTSLLKLLYEVDYPHVFITSRAVEFRSVTEAFFRNKFPWIEPKNIIMGKAHHEPGGLFKSEMIKRNNVALHIEDCLEEAEIIVDKTSARLIIIPQPWNENFKIEHPRIKYLGSHLDSSGSWPLVRFLTSQSAKEFLR